MPLFSLSRAELIFLERQNKRLVVKSEMNSNRTAERCKVMSLSLFLRPILCTEVKLPKV